MVTLDDSSQDSCCLLLLVDGLFLREFGSHSCQILFQSLMVVSFFWSLSNLFVFLYFSLMSEIKIIFLAYLLLRERECVTSYYWSTMHGYAYTHILVLLNIVLYDDCSVRNKNFISLYDIVSCYPENKTRVPQGRPQNLGSPIKKGLNYNVCYSTILENRCVI